MLVAPSETMLWTDEFSRRPQGSPPRVRERAAGAVVGREGERGDRTSEGGIGVGEEPCCGRGAHRVPGEAASVHPQLPVTATGGVMDRQHTGGEMQRLGGDGTRKHQGMSWSPQGVLALAALEAARRNGELDAWRRDGALPERALPEPVRKAA